MFCCRRLSLRFTLVELVVAVAVCGILTGLLIPAVLKVRQKAKYFRWQAFNYEINLSEDTLINYNFEFDDFLVNHQGELKPAIYNGACGSAQIDGSQALCHGILMNSPEWGYGNGRWSFKNSLMFDGRNDYIKLVDSKQANFDPGSDDFTITTWVKIDDPCIQYIFSKAKNNAISQYFMHYNGNKMWIGAGDPGNGGSGGSTKGHWGVDLDPDKWYHFAFVNRVGKGAELYLNGELLGNIGAAESGTVNDAEFLIGALDGENHVARQNFGGEMDEFMVFKRALMPSEIKNHYKKGNPY
jgi:hypothetical protein